MFRLGGDNELSGAPAPTESTGEGATCRSPLHKQDWWDTIPPYATPGAGFLVVTGIRLRRTSRWEGLRAHAVRPYGNCTPCRGSAWVRSFLFFVEFEMGP